MRSGLLACGVLGTLAVGLLVAALSPGPHCQSQRLELARRSEASQDLPAAIALYQDVVRHAADDYNQWLDGLLGAARCARQAGNTGLASALLTEASDADPAAVPPALRHQLVELHLAVGEADAALDHAFALGEHDGGFADTSSLEQLVGTLAPTEHGGRVLDLMSSLADAQAEGAGAPLGLLCHLTRTGPFPPSWDVERAGLAARLEAMDSTLRCGPTGATP